MTEWAASACPNGCPRPSGAPAPGPRMLADMSPDELGRSRVLLGNLEPMVRLGMIDVPTPSIGFEVDGTSST